ncbi:hypothetical protein GGR28_000239 [Lewinella aquimaris]|uniref:DUF3857 domain-containing protein n=1 Tax=Neolewinella aquimaris TaxID=1835722 RepID=A0A840E6A4_9BACT|nr:DUF3857 domain-containing protein [Neolewinella aquimaris]MBB4077638.1 hypothetical protein [Neolewinella aquimaris]
MKVTRLLFLLLVVGIHPLAAQYEKGLEFGRVSKEDRQLTTVPGDSTASAYVLYDHLDLAYRYNDTDGPSLFETHHRRVKLLKPASFDLANVSLHYDRDHQSIDNLRAVIHLPDGGTIQLRDTDFVSDRDSDGRATVKFTFPRVVAGAIIEYTYSRSQESILSPTVYYFQESIPVRWAEYTALIPPYYQYMSLANPAQYHLKEAKLSLAEFGPSFGVVTYGSRVNGIEHSELRWVMKDLAAFERQPYTNNAEDYIPRIRLQLQKVQYPGEGPRPIFSDWEETVNSLHDRQDFGRYYRKKGNYAKLWKAAEDAIAAAGSDREKIEAAYRFVIDRLSWNGNYGVLASASPNAVLDDGTGNSADLNICLLALLNEAGITAHPLLVSLRNSGAPIEVYPVVNQFDHLMVYTELGGQPFLLDANDPDRPAGLPRVAALNHRGWVADPDRPRWIDIDVPAARRIVMQEISVTEDGTASVALRSRLESYFAFSARSELRNAKTPAEAPLAAEIIARFPEAEVTMPGTVAASDVPTAPLDYSLKLRIPSAATAVNDYLYVQPLLLSVLDDELDDVERRLYPIDFEFPWEQRFIVNIRVPEGYVLDETPPALKVRAEDGSMEGTYATNVMVDGAVTLIFNVSLTRTFYPADQYTGLRDMYRRIIELQNSPLVFRREH